MPVCRFYLKGYCRYGSSCRFEHPGEIDDSEYPKSNVENFSFKTALGGSLPSELSTNFRFNNSNSNNDSSTSGFSFAQALGTTNLDQTSQNDIDMSENQTFNFRQALLNNNNYNQPFNTLQQHKQDTTSIFSPNISFQQTTLQSNLTFGQPVNQPLPVFGQNSTQNFQNSQNIPTSYQEPTNTKNNVFSVLEELSEAELRSFGNSLFEFRKIPVRPPPKVLC